MAVSVRTKSYIVDALADLTSAAEIVGILNNSIIAESGTVESVTLTGDGVVLSSTPSSAVTVTGTLTATLATHSANQVLAGPSTGSAATPTFRALVSADLPAAIVSTSPLGIGSNHIAFGAVAPTTGTWAKGDVCFNTGVNATGNNAAWSCTTAGTPGTWTAWPNLA